MSENGLGTGNVPWQDLLEEAASIMEAKGRDYRAGEIDLLANFRREAVRAGVTPLQVWLIYLNKHHSAICSYVRSGGQNESEPIKGRFVDMLNYLYLGWLLVKETEAGKPSSVSAGQVGQVRP